MTSVPCPRCGMLVDLEQEVCTHCRTPRDDMEMEEGRMLARSEELRLQRRPKRIAAGAAAAVLLAAVWLMRGLATGPLLAAWSEFRMEVEKTRQPSHWIKEPLPFSPVAIAVPVAAARIPPAEVVVSSFVYLHTSAQASQPIPEAAEAPIPVPAQPLASPPSAPAALPFGGFPPGPGQLHVKGLVYDLKTGEPVADVRVRFEQRQSGSSWESITSLAGRYQVFLNKHTPGDILVMIEAPGYRKGLLEDRDPPYRGRSSEDRAAVIAETIDSDLEAVPVRYRESADALDLDLVLVPQARK